MRDNGTIVAQEVNTLRLGGERRRLQLSKPLSATCLSGLIGTGAMDCKQYSIYPDDAGCWLARLNDRVAGPYLSYGLALRVAAAEITCVRKLGNNARFVVKNASGTVRTQHCFCK